MQLKLFPSGAFQMTWGVLTDPGTHDFLVGVSPGNGVLDPGEIDLSASLPFSSGTQPTVYEVFTNGVDIRDLAGTSQLWTPNGSGGFAVVPFGPCASTSPYGNGCPDRIGPVLYEYFDVANGDPIDISNTDFTLFPNMGGSLVLAPVGMFNANFSNNLFLSDDEVSADLQLGFTGLYGGLAISTIRVSSNGFVYLEPGSDSGCCSGDIQSFLDNEARVAGFWTDLNPTAGGGVYFDTFPGMAMVTWDNVPEYGQANANTFQIKFWADGRIELNYQTVGVVQTYHNVLSGFSIGGQIPDPGEVDFSTAPVTSTRGGVPLRHTTNAPLMLGTTATLSVISIPSSAAISAVLFGIANPNLNLTPLGAPNCFVLTTGDIAVPVVIGTPGIGTLSLPIPSGSIYAGVTLYTQGVAAGNLGGINALDVISSNGLRHVLGY
ncbi:MAG: hypothetical protein IPM29_10600 [Planctomycetes bacterium]|nr:hypothetical protein [Planctomycetota bacterium]